MNLKNKACSDRLIVEKVDKIMEIVESDRHVSTYTITQKLKISRKTVWNYLHKAGLKKKLDVWGNTNWRKKNPFGPNWSLRFFDKM